MSRSRNPGGRARAKDQVWWQQKTLEGDRERGKLPVGISPRGAQNRPGRRGEPWWGGSMSAWKPEALVLSALPGYLGKRNAFPGRADYQGTKSPSLPWTEGSASALYLGKREKYCQKAGRKTGNSNSALVTRRGRWYGDGGTFPGCRPLGCSKSSPGFCFHRWGPRGPPPHNLSPPNTHSI